MISLAGLSFGIVSGVAISWILVKLLNGVFDPPPEALSIPWPYVLGAFATVLISIVTATIIAIRKIERTIRVEFTGASEG